MWPSMHGNLETVLAHCRHCVAFPIACTCHACRAAWHRRYWSFKTTTNRHTSSVSCASDVSTPLLGTSILRSLMNIPSLDSPTLLKGSSPTLHAAKLALPRCRNYGHGRTWRRARRRPRRGCGRAWAWATADVPLVAVVTRLTHQKGIHLIKHAAWRTLERGAQWRAARLRAGPKSPGEAPPTRTQASSVL